MDSHASPTALLAQVPSSSISWFALTIACHDIQTGKLLVVLTHELWFQNLFQSVVLLIIIWRQGANHTMPIEFKHDAAELW